MLSTRSSWRRLKISIRSRHSRRALPTHRSMCAFAFGAWTGVRITLILSPWKTASKARLNFASRSWINNRGRWPRSSRARGHHHIAAIDAERMLAIVGNDQLAPIAAQVRDKLALVVERAARLSDVRAWTKAGLPVEKA